MLGQSYGPVALEVWAGFYTCLGDLKLPAFDIGARQLGVEHDDRCGGEGRGQE